MRRCVLEAGIKANVRRLYRGRCINPCLYAGRAADSDAGCRAHAPRRALLPKRVSLRRYAIREGIGVIGRVITQT